VKENALGDDAMIGRIALFLLAASYCSPLSATRWADEMFTTRSHDFGTVARGAKAEFEFVLKNKYIEDVHIASARVSCSCTSVSIKNAHLKTYERGSIVAKFNTTSYRGQRRATITVTFDKPYRARVHLQVKGYIRSDVTLKPASVELGEIGRGTAVEKMIRVTRIGRRDWRILEVRSSNPHLSGEVVRTTPGWDRVTCDVRARLSSGAPVGYIRDHLMLVTSDSRGKYLPVHVEGRICPALVVSPSSFFLGALTPGQVVTRQVVVSSTAKVPFRVLSVTSDHGAVEARLSQSGAAKPIYVIPLAFTARDRPGKVVEVVRIQTDLNDEVAEVTMTAVVRDESAGEP
jgi:hypothetical protein